MATYDYKCEQCGAEMELNHGMNEKRPHCPECDKDALQVQHKQARPFHTQGNGWGGKGHPVL